MSEPSTGAPPSPWTPRPLAPIPPRTGGCGKPALLGCGALILLLGIGAILFVSNLTKFLRWTFGRLETQILAQLPPDLPAAERERLRAAFTAVDRTVAAGKIDPLSLQQLQSKLIQLSSQPNRQLTAQDVRELTEALEHLAAGKAPAAPSGAPAAPVSTAPPAAGRPVAWERGLGGGAAGAA